MARPLTHSLPSTTPEAGVREHFGLSQDELGRYLGVSRALVAHFEAGRRRPSRLADQRLARLAALLPPPTGHGPVAPHWPALATPTLPAPPPLPAFDGEWAARPLQRRLLQVQAQAARLRWELHQASKGAKLQQRRAWALAQLRAALPPADLADAAELAHLHRWLTVLAADIEAAAPTPASRAAQALLVLRIQALEYEAAALGPLLTAHNPPE
ncbi:helix-turn-helix domain-containing protein [Hymenobacter sp. B81]|uniref:helix-turn-helix domain-containing protein n=1 Tax=Hymenobacter sp. B81 TaxID=3344878 RepID=UPI0037DC07AA